MKPMNTMFRTFGTALATLALLSACGGGGGGGGTAVSNLAATTVAYSRTMTVTVIGTGLSNPDLQMIVEGPCGVVTKVTGGTDLQQSFTCVISGVGALIPRIRLADNREIASLRLNVPMPQVSMTVTQGVRSGSFTIDLDPVAAPITVNNFLTYVNEGFYRSTIFHRVIAGFVAQGGGFIAGPTVKPPTHPTIQLESQNGLTNLRGTIAMARTSDANSATSQFYFNLIDNPDLDYKDNDNPGYAVFGKVSSGLDIVDEIGKVDTAPYPPIGLTNLPLSNVVITAMTQIR